LIGPRLLSRRPSSVNCCVDQFDFHALRLRITRSVHAATNRRKTTPPRPAPFRGEFFKQCRGFLSGFGLFLCAGSSCHELANWPPRTAGQFGLSGGELFLRGQASAISDLLSIGAASVHVSQQLAIGVDLSNPPAADRRIPWRAWQNTAPVRGQQTSMPPETWEALVLNLGAKAVHGDH